MAQADTKTQEKELEPASKDPHVQTKKANK
jgi:hypothetical protein